RRRRCDARPPRLPRPTPQLSHDGPRRVMIRPRSGHSPWQRVGRRTLHVSAPARRARMRVLRMLAVVCALVAMSLARAGAQQETRTFQDPRGWFSLSLPAEWNIATDPSRSLGAGFIQGFERSDAAGVVRARLAADGPNSLGGYAVPFI